jgi:hypothetical protein
MSDHFHVIYKPRIKALAHGLGIDWGKLGGAIYTLRGITCGKPNCSTNT